MWVVSLNKVLLREVRARAKLLFFPFFSVCFVSRFRSLSILMDGGAFRSSNLRSAWTKPPPGRPLLPSRPPRPPLMPAATTHLAPPSQVGEHRLSIIQQGAPCVKNNNEIGAESTIFFLLGRVQPPLLQLTSWKGMERRQRRRRRRQKERPCLTKARRKRRRRMRGEMWTATRLQSQKRWDSVLKGPML